MFLLKDYKQFSILLISILVTQIWPAAAGLSACVPASDSITGITDTWTADLAYLSRKNCVALLKVLNEVYDQLKTL